MTNGIVSLIKQSFPHVFLLGILTLALSCSPQSLVTEKLDPGEYPVKNKVDFGLDHNPTFAIYGDSQVGWRARETFMQKRNWRGWRLLAAPYWFAQGVIGGINAMRHVPDWGVKERRMMREAILDYHQQSPVDFVFGMGDFVTDGRRANEWQRFLKENREETPFINSIPLVPLNGNHEHVTDSAFGEPNYKAIFEYPLFYKLEFPDAAVFVLHSGFLVDQYLDIPDSVQNQLFKTWFIAEANSEKPGWLEKELVTCEKNFKIVALHHPPVSFGKHHVDWFNQSFGPDLPGKLKQLIELFHRTGVQLILAGHEHHYERSELISGDSRIQVLVSGGGGVPLRDVLSRTNVENYTKNYNDLGIGVRSVIQSKDFHYGIIQVEKEKMTIEVFQVEKGERDHTLLDSLSISSL